MSIQLSSRFWNKIKKTSTCWLWTAAIAPNGYGVFNTREKKRTRYAHRLSYIYFNGDISDDLTVDHLCRVRNCVNPRHLEAVCQKENVLRGISSPSMNAKKENCKCGNKYSPYFYKGKEYRRCKNCHNINSKKSYHKK